MITQVARATMRITRRVPLAPDRVLRPSRAWIAKGRWDPPLGLVEARRSTLGREAAGDRLATGPSIPHPVHQAGRLFEAQRTNRARTSQGRFARWVAEVPSARASGSNSRQQDQILPASGPSQDTSDRSASLCAKLLRAYDRRWVGQRNEPRPRWSMGRSMDPLNKSQVPTGMRPIPRLSLKTWG